LLLIGVQHPEMKWAYKKETPHLRGLVYAVLRSGCCCFAKEKGVVIAIGDDEKEV